LIVPLAFRTAGAWPVSTQLMTCCIGLAGAMLPGPGAPAGRAGHGVPQQPALGDDLQQLAIDAGLASLPGQRRADQMS
jgi:hypothetical protein